MTLTRLILIISALVLLVLPGVVSAQATYVGSETCRECHTDYYNDWIASGHPWKLRQAAVAEAWATPLPKGLDWEDISYVIGGFAWKLRYMDVDGYIITADEDGPGNTQFNLATGEWVDYHAGEVKPYNCGSCHTTGFSDMGNQDGLPGIEGTWEFEGIHCEECHGPGSDHAALPSSMNITVDTSSAACGECHIRGDPMTIPASGGFVRHHEQYNELLASPHAMLDCTDCHDAHKRSEFSIVTECTDCHDEILEPKAMNKLGLQHIDNGVTCADCHMPFAAKTAVAFNDYKADIRSHQSKITLDKDAKMFNDEGTLANGMITTDYACLGCHQKVLTDAEAKGKPEKALKWALKGAKKIHKIKK